MAKAMSTSEWDRCAIPKLLFAQLGNSVSARKLRLIACACCRRVAHLFKDARCQRALEVNEAFADGEAAKRQLGTARRAAEEAFDRLDARGRAHPATFAACAVWYALRAGERGRDGFAFPDAVWVASSVRLAGCAAGPGKKSDRAALQGASKEERAAQAELIRDIVGNPFRTVTIDRRWRTSNVVDLARTIYDERAFERLPILADALMDAGCNDGDILDHCRRDGVHVRGCWVVDRLPE